MREASHQVIIEALRCTQSDNQRTYFLKRHARFILLHYLITVLVFISVLMQLPTYFFISMILVCRFGLIHLLFLIKEIIFQILKHCILNCQ